jgi:cobalt/nickel transport system permease protein
VVTHTTIQAMHMSDGIVNAPTSLAFGVLAALAMAFCAYKARTELDERTVPLAGLVAAFIFAVQMVNFPILPGVSGHLLGGALAAILVGPFTGALCIAIVLIVQSLLFADGGVTALGTNITNMAVVGVVFGYGTAVVLYKLVSARRSAVPVPAVGVIAFLAAIIGTVFAAMGFVVEYAIGGAAPVSLGTVASYMLGTHVLIGIGEGIITALTVMAVTRARPDLVYLLRAHRVEAGVAA